MEETITEIFKIPNVDGTTVDYYPHIKADGRIGYFLDEPTVQFNAQNFSQKEEKYTEYVHYNKRMVIHETGERDYMLHKQVFQKIADGLFVVSKIEYIDPNRFPILCKYHAVCRRTIKTYDDKYITVSIITEEYPNENYLGRLTYIKISFIIENTDKFMNGVIRHIKAALSSICNNMSPK